MGSPACLIHVRAKSSGELRGEADLHGATVWLPAVQGSHDTIARFHRISSTFLMLCMNPSWMLVGSHSSFQPHQAGKRSKSHLKPG
jgi:hypothetical protein